MVDRVPGLDLGDQLHTGTLSVGKQLSHRTDVCAIAHERYADEIDVYIDGRTQRPLVVLGGTRHASLGSGQVHTFAGTHYAAADYLRHYVLATHFLHRQDDLAVGQEDDLLL